VLLYTTKFCCDSVKDHPNACAFNLQDFLPGHLPGNKPLADPVSVDGGKANEKPKPKYRPPKQWPALDFRLIEWLTLEHLSDPLHTVHPPHLILSQTQRFILTCTNPKQIQSPSNITSLLDESSEWSDEWANKIFKVIHKYDTDLSALNSHQKGKKRKRS